MSAWDPDKLMEEENDRLKKQVEVLLLACTSVLHEYDYCEEMQCLSLGLAAALAKMRTTRDRVKGGEV